jgi:hypothetical protein
MSMLKRIVLVSVLFAPTGALADDPPKLDISPTCAGAAQFSVGAERDKQACLDDEHAAEGTLAQNWSNYNANDKTQCIGTVKTGGAASYVELLSCLEVMRDAKEFRENDSLPPSQQPTRHRGK